MDNIDKMSLAKLEETIKLAQKKLILMKEFYTKENMNHLYNILAALTEENYNKHDLLLTALYKLLITFSNSATTSVSVKYNKLPEFNLVSQTTVTFIKDVIQKHFTILMLEADSSITHALLQSIFLDNTVFLKVKDLLIKYNSVINECDCAKYIPELVDYISKKLKLTSQEDDDYANLEKKYKAFTALNDANYSGGGIHQTQTREEFYKLTKINSSKILCEYITDLSTVYNKYLTKYSIKAFNSSPIFDKNWKLLEKLRYVSINLLTQHPEAFATYVRLFDPSLSYDFPEKANNMLRKLLLKGEYTMVKLLLEDQRVTNNLVDTTLNQSITIEEIIEDLTKVYNSCTQVLTCNIKNGNGIYIYHNYPERRDKLVDNMTSTCEKKNFINSLMNKVLDIYISSRSTSLNKKLID